MVPGGTYYYRFKAVNSAGTSWSATQTFQTSSSASAPRPPLSSASSAAPRAAPAPAGGAAAPGSDPAPKAAMHTPIAALLLMVRPLLQVRAVTEGCCTKIHV